MRRCGVKNGENVEVGGRRLEEVDEFKHLRIVGGS